MSESLDLVDCTSSEAPLSGSRLDELRAACPDLTLDGRARPSRAQLAERMGSYWLADECVLYIGLAGQPLRTRVRQYYKTPLGAAKPHKGGWWLKTLSVLDALFVHYSATGDFKSAEEDMLRAFATGVSDDSRAALSVAEPVMPFANLRDADWRRRQHRIANATCDAPMGRTPARVPGVAPAATPRRATARRPTGPQRAAPQTLRAVTPRHRSQTVTAKDVKVGQVRIPRGATKTILPSERCDISVRLRGRELECRWDPRYGPPERSGVIRVGTAAAQALLQPGDLLAVSTSTSGVVSLD